MPIDFFIAAEAADISDDDVNELIILSSLSVMNIKP
jgi:hypothetical protein